MLELREAVRVATEPLVEFCGPAIVVDLDIMIRRFNDGGSEPLVDGIQRVNAGVLGQLGAPSGPAG